jgi:hypothetical protein
MLLQACILPLCRCHRLLPGHKTFAESCLGIVIEPHGHAQILHGAERKVARLKLQPDRGMA